MQLTCDTVDLVPLHCPILWSQLDALPALRAAKDRRGEDKVSDVVILVGRHLKHAYILAVISTGPRMVMEPLASCTHAMLILQFCQDSHGQILGHLVAHGLLRCVP